jgi:hypothetical protein
LRTRVYFFFSKLSLISISEGGKGPQFPGIQESSGGTIWNEWAFFSRLPYGLQCRQTRKYNDDHLVNSTTLFTTFTTGLFLASDSERACLTDRFLLFTIFFTWRLGLRTFGDNDGSAYTDSEILCGCIAQFRLPFYMPLLTQKMLHIRLADTCFGHFITHHPGVLHAEPSTRLRLLFLVITVYSSR